MNANSEGVRSAGRTFSEAELRIVCQIVAAGGRSSRTQLMVQVCLDVSRFGGQVTAEVAG